MGGLEDRPQPGRALTTLGVLVWTGGGAPPGHPADRPIGRAALSLDGVRVVFGDRLVGGRMTGLLATEQGWEPVVDMAVDAVHDRYPSQIHHRVYAAIDARDVVIGNPVALTLLCRDKLETQRQLEAAGLDLCPTVVGVPEAFEDALADWGAGFLKPRFGALGIGVTRVVPGDALPAVVPGVVPDRPDPAILQRAVTPPRGFAGISVRALCQRLPGGAWLLVPPVARRSTDDPVVNVARGAAASPADDVLEPDTLDALRVGCHATCDALAALPDGDALLELGLDFAIDADGRPWLIEVNSRPQGRLEALARQWPDRFADLHIEACARPLRYLVWSVSRPRPAG